jgi:pyruvate carboxylase
MSPYAYRTSHPAVEPLVVSLLGTNRDTGLDIELLAQISAEIEKHIPKYLQYANQTRFSIIDTNVILHQTPGGMLSNLVNQLREMGEIDKLEAVFHALPGVRKALGQVPLVTPTSQIVGIQTVNNVLFDGEDEAFSRITQQVKDLCFGLYGRTPRPIDKAVQKKAIADHPRGEKPITGRPGEILEPELETARTHAGELAKDLDDLLIYALFPVTGKRFLKWKYGHEEPPEDTRPKTMDEVEQERELVKKALAGELVEERTAAEPAAGGLSPAAPVPPGPARIFDVRVNGEPFRVEVRDTGLGAHAATAQPLSAAAPPAAAGTGPTGAGAPVPAASAPPSAGAVSGAVRPGARTAQGGLADGEQGVIAPMPGMIVEIVKKPGEAVKAGDTVCIIEAMKMNNNIETPWDGEIKELRCKEGDSVAKGDILCVVARP